LERETPLEDKTMEDEQYTLDDGKKLFCFTSAQLSGDFANFFALLLLEI
jgi:hypothetical protein